MRKVPGEGIAMDTRRLEEEVRCLGCNHRRMDHGDNLHCYSFGCGCTKFVNSGLRTIEPPCLADSPWIAS